MPSSIRRRLSLTLLLIGAAPATGWGQAEVYRFTGRATIYDLVGTVSLSAGEGQTTVTVQRRGADAGQLRVTHDDERLVVIFPGSHIVYQPMGPRSESTLDVRDDGTFNDRGGGGHRVRVTGSGSGTEAWADLAVSIPRGAEVTVNVGIGAVKARNVDGRLHISTASADVTAEGTAGSLSVDVGSGDVHLDGATGDVKLDTGSGDITIERADATMDIDTGSGDIKVQSLSGQHAHLEAGSGDITVARATVPDLELETGSGDIEATLNGTVDRLSLNTGSGSATLHLPADLGAQLHIETGSGDIETDFPVTITHKEHGALTGRIGDGHARIQIETGSGDVELRRE